MDISVIVPVYNSEATLEACVNSIANTCGGVKEILLVNNGSQDSSAVICKKLASRYDNVKYAEIDHANVCDARNHGIDIATGKYIAFVDSDDTVNEEIYSSMYEVAERDANDLVFCRYNLVEKGISTPRRENKLVELVVDKKLEYLFWSADNVMGTACRSLFKRELLTDIRFDNTIRITEDRVLMLQAIVAAVKPAVVDYYGYNYICPDVTTRKYVKAGYEQSLLKALAHNNRTLATYSQELVEYNQFATYEYILKFVVYTDKYDAKKIKQVLSCDVLALNNRLSYKAYCKHVSRMQRVKAFLFRHKLFLLLNIKQRIADKR